MSEFRNTLNNLAQSMAGKPQVRYEMTRKGPNHEVEWTAKVTVGNKEYGSGKGFTQAAAKELAAEAALAKLKEEDTSVDAA